jgi:hypothetical protein
MNKDLQSVKDARDAAGQRSSADDKGLPLSLAEGEKRAEGDDKVRKLADTAVKNNPDLFKGLDAIPRDVIVKMVDDAREKGDDEEVQRLETWCLHYFEPQKIGVQLHVELRHPNG